MARRATQFKPASVGVSGTPDGGSRFPSWLLALVLALATLALYWPATRGNFINLDDAVFVTDNIHVQNGLNWMSLKWAFSNTEQAVTWAPILWVSHQLAWQLFGPDPWGHHLLNLLLHAANTALVFLVFRQMTGATWRSWFLAALFGWHPLRVESVAWVSERKDVLSTFFGLLALMCYCRYTQGKAAQALSRPAIRIQRPKVPGSPVTLPSTLHPLSARWYYVALFCFALGLMSKPMLVTLPCVMLLLDYWPLQRTTGWKSLLAEKIPFFALAAATSGVTFMAQKHGAITAMQALPLTARIANGLVSCCRYLGKMLWPTDLAVFYPLPASWPPAEVLWAGLFLGGLSGWLWVWRRRRPFLLVGWLWFLGTLVPVIGLVQVGGQAMADRYTYIPSLGVLILIIWGGCELTRRWRIGNPKPKAETGRKSAEGQPRSTILFFLSVAGSTAIVLCLGLTRQQIGYWQDSETLFQQALAVTENNYIAHGSLGYVLDQKGQTDAAISHLEEAIRLKPDYPAAHLNLGIALDKQGQLDAAIREFQEASRLAPDVPKARFNFGIALGKKGRLDEAISQLQEASRLMPADAEAHYTLGLVLAMKGQTDAAIRQYQEAIGLKPDYPDACNTLGRLWTARGENLDQARTMFEKAVQLEPKNAALLDSLDIVLLKLDRPREALDYSLKAIGISDQPDASLYDHLGDIYAALHQRDQAADAWRKSLTVAPNPEVQKKLAALPAP